MLVRFGLILLFSLAVYFAYKLGYTKATIPVIRKEILRELSDRELYALDLLDKLNSDRDREIGFGTLFPLLDELERNLLISSRFEDSEPPRRMFYRLKKQCLAPTKADIS